MKFAQNIPKNLAVCNTNGSWNMNSFSLGFLTVRIKDQKKNKEYFQVTNQLLPRKSKVKEL